MARVSPASQLRGQCTPSLWGWPGHSLAGVDGPAVCPPTLPVPPFPLGPSLQEAGAGGTQVQLGNL